MRDYPQMTAPEGGVQPAPRRVRGVLANRTVFDTTRALYVWEWTNYPQYYIPLDDVNPGVLVDEHHQQRLRHGTAHRHGVHVGDTHRPGAARVHQAEDGVEDQLVETVRFDWAGLDAWYEEDEQVFVHPRNPYTRVDAIRSSRPVRVELDGVVLAETASPVMVFETGLPTRYYIPAPTCTSSTCGPATPSPSARETPRGLGGHLTVGATSRCMTPNGKTMSASCARCTAGSRPARAREGSCRTQVLVDVALVRLDPCGHHGGRRATRC